MRLWHERLDRWQDRLPVGQRLGAWLFSADLDHVEGPVAAPSGTGSPRSSAATTIRTSVCTGYGHTVATTLVADGQLLQAQQRLGHADASTTLRQYCHALPLRDVDVADHLDELYR